jgi:hypothetical protein
VLTLSSVALAWISFQWLPGHVSPDGQAAFFLAWSLPLAAVLGWWSYRGSVSSPTPSARAAFTGGSSAVATPSGALLATGGRMQSAGDAGVGVR